MLPVQDYSISRALGIKKTRADELKIISSAMFVQSKTAGELIKSIRKSKKMNSLEKIYISFVIGVESGFRKSQSHHFIEEDEEEGELPLFHKHFNVSDIR